MCSVIEGCETQLGPIPVWLEALDVVQALGLLAGEPGVWLTGRRRCRSMSRTYPMIQFDVEQNAYAAPKPEVQAFFAGRLAEANGLCPMEFFMTHPNEHGLTHNRQAVKGGLIHPIFDTDEGDV